jgi:hypothetical protein
MILESFWITTGHMTLENPEDKPVRRQALQGDIYTMPLKLYHELKARGIVELAAAKHIQ